MANLSSLKDPLAISILALAVAGGSSAYFHSEISKLKEQQAANTKELADIKKHLSAIILSNPEAGKQLEQVMKAVKILDTRLAETQERIRQTQSAENVPGRKTYQRMTDRTGRPVPALKRPEIHRQPEPEMVEHYDPELDDDIAAMTA
jgi:DNA repair exonuclease SbcCD ATPase subunit